MKAAWFETFGPVRDMLQVGDKPKPKPAPGEVRVRLQTRGVDPTLVGERVWVYQAQFAPWLGTAAAVPAGIARASEMVEQRGPGGCVALDVKS